MSDLSQIPHINSTSAYKNKLLFTTHYLEHRITEQALWTNHAIYELAAAKLAELREKREAIQPQNLKEAQLEKQWIHWILNEILGHHFAVQVTLDYGDSKHGIPDMVFTGTNAEAAAIGNAKHSPDTLSDAVAIGDAKARGVNFDKASKGKQSAVQQIDKYLRYSELPWGILTDGRYWRLYERNSSKYNKYYEIDLEAILEKNDVSQFLYFYLFFRQQAFTGNWLDNVLKESQDFAENLRDSLEEEVFAALEHIAQGFLDYHRNYIEKPPAADSLNQIYGQSLILLYRLLFVFYAESRDVLPMNNENYRQRSLKNLRKQAVFVIGEGKKRSVNDSSLYTQLNDLFYYIDIGQSDFDIAPYNGRLFSGKHHPFLAEKGVGDFHLAPAIHKLATIEVKRGRSKETVNVDYRDLDIGHLGTIYEKLLEYRLDIATEDLVTSGKNQSYKPAKPGQTATKKLGEVYLRTGNNERKVTGSYYTPEYIVRFIVEKTLEPLLLEITQQYATGDEEGNWIVSEPVAIRDRILALNVLDPATGSGHFAVDVVVYIAEWLHGLALDLPELENESDPLAYWMRQVAGACIYAVDINPLAVELAKLSIWLKTLAKDKPLSFLDHHIRVGNSLVGTSLAEIEDLAPGQAKKKSNGKKVSDKQAPLFDEEAFTRNVQSAVGRMAQIENVLADDVSEVKAQEKMYADLRADMKIYEQLATVWTARHFGLEMDNGEWQSLYKLSLEGALTPRLKNIIARAEAIAARPDMRFFHWDVAFPEVFFDDEGNRKDNAGFDAVVGNPPYVRQERITPIKAYLESHYEVYSGTADLFIYFYELGLKHLTDEGRLGYITSGTFYNTNSAKPFREYVHENAGFEWVANFGENQPFKDAEMVYPTIAIMKPEKPEETFKHYFMDGNVRYRDMGETFETATFVDSLSNVTEMDEWRFQDKKYTALYYTVTSNYQTLKEVTNDEIYYGIKTGLNDVFIIDDETKRKLIQSHSSSSEVIKPMLRGQDSRPWYQIESGLHLIFTHTDIENIEKYPAIRDYLEQYKEQLQPKPSGWKGNWSGRKSGSYSWYQIQDHVAYHEKFNQPKIFWAEIAKLPRFSWDDGTYCSNNKAHMLIPNSKSILCVLNSRVSWFVISQIAVPLRLRGGLWQYQLTQQFVERLPIPELTSAQESELATIAETITAYSGERYQLHQSVRRNLLDDFGEKDSEISTLVGLYQWWNYDVQTNLSEFNEELQRRFGNELSVGKKRDDWRKYLSENRQSHEAITQKIVDEEIRLNAIVYDAFKLDEAERQLIESATKYPYGAV